MVGVAQLVERRSVAPNVAGSIPVSHPNLQTSVSGAPAWIIAPARQWGTMQRRAAPGSIRFHIRHARWQKENRIRRLPAGRELPSGRSRRTGRKSCLNWACTPSRSSFTTRSAARLSRRQAPQNNGRTETLGHCIPRLMIGFRPLALSCNEGKATALDLISQFALFCLS